MALCNLVSLRFVRYYSKMEELNTDQENTVLRVKLDSFSLVLKKLANVFSNVEAETSTPLVEPQIINRILTLANGFQSLKSLEGKEGEIYASFLKSITNIIQNIGMLPLRLVGQDYERRVKILRIMKKLENEIKEFLPVVYSIDQTRKEVNYETFGGLLQKLIDLIQEKYHLISRGG